MRLTLLNLSVVALASLSLTSVASAQTREPTILHVSTAGVNLHSDRDVMTLYTRLAIAAKAVCDSEVVDPMTQIADRACETQSLAEAISAVHSDKLLHYASSMQKATRLQPEEGLSLALNLARN